jgi:phosphatidylglycerol---prolipoprotein diacylglyceryl transferase
MALLASIPSPSSGGIEIGPFTLRAYGFLIALGVVVAVLITQRRFAARGGDPDVVQRMVMWVVPAGIVGARLYHVITDNQRFRPPLGSWTDVVAIWEGGLGIWGAIAGGTLAAWFFLRREGIRIGLMADAIAPALLVAQAIGRIGNYFNQELFGRPTDLPWAVEIDPSHRPPGYEGFATFHPTFLYEALWNLFVAALLVWVVPRVWPRLRTGGLLLLYVIGYTAGRLCIELVRIDSANEILGQRVNVWVSILVMLAAVVWLVGFQRGHWPVPPDSVGAGDSPVPDRETATSS